jgi:hypothetical protein
MCKSLCLVLCIMFLPIFVTGQDIIIRTNGDTLKCTVTKIDSDAVYFKLKQKRSTLETFILRDKIMSMKIPVAPDNPDRRLCEKKIKNYTAWGIIGETAFVLGGISTIYGIVKLSGSGYDVSHHGSTIVAVSNTNDDRSGNFVLDGLPFFIGGAIIGSISLHKVKKYKSRLKNLYNLSIDVGNHGTYNELKLSYRF